MKENRHYRIYDKQDQKYIARSAIYWCDNYGDNSRRTWNSVHWAKRVINKSKTPTRYEVHSFTELFEMVVA